MCMPYIIRKDTQADKEAPVWHPAFHKWIFAEVDNFFKDNVPSFVHLYYSSMYGMTATVDGSCDEFRAYYVAMMTSTRDDLLNVLKLFFYSTIGDAHPEYVFPIPPPQPRKSRSASKTRN